MKTTIVLLTLCFVLPAGEERSHAADAQGKENQSRETTYPYCEIAKVHETVLDAMTDNYFSKFPDVDKEHTAKLKSFARTECSSKSFVEQIVTDEHIGIFDRAAKDRAYRDTKEFKDSFTLMVNVAVPVAKMKIGGLRDVYVSKYVEKDPIKTELLEIATGDNRQYASWVHGELTADQFRKGTNGKRDVQKGDRFFAFCSPPSTWDDMCGREGYLHVRGKKIIEAIVNRMN